MLNKFRKFVTMLIVVSTLTISGKPAHAIVPTISWAEIKGTMKEIALTIKEIASLATSIYSLYNIVASIGQSFSGSGGLGIAASVSQLANQATNFTSTIDSAIGKVEDIDATTGALMTKFSGLVADGDMASAQSTFANAVTLKDGATLEEANKHRHALEYMRFSNATAAVSLANGCRSHIDVEKFYTDSMTALSATSDMSQREGFDNEMNTKMMVVQSTCLIMLSAEEIKMKATDIVIVTNTVASNMTDSKTASQTGTPSATD